MKGIAYLPGDRNKKLNLWKEYQENGRNSEMTNDRFGTCASRALLAPIYIEKGDFKKASELIKASRDLSATLDKLLKLLNQTGRMYLFYTFPSEMVKSNLEIEVDNLNLQYDIIDFSQLNHQHWVMKKEILQNLKQKFQDESSIFLYNNRMAECEGNISTSKRYLYILGVIMYLF